MDKLLSPVTMLVTIASLATAQDTERRVTTESVKATCKSVTLAVDNADIHTVIRTIAKQASANVVVAPEVQGSVTLDLDDVPWREALESSVGVLGFRVDETSGVLRIVPGKPATPAPRVYFAFENVDIRKIIDTIAKISGANIIVAPEVQGKITLQMRDLPWRDALGAAVETLGYVIQEQPHGIVRIVAPPPERPAAEPKITASYDDTDVRTIIEDIAKQAAANVVVAPEVRGTLTLRLESIPWTDALTAAAQTLGYRVELDKSGIFRIRR